MQASLSQSTRDHYERAWKKLVLFCESLGLPACLPVSLPMILLFIAHLYNSGAAPASIVSIISAVGYFHKINGHSDPSSSFIVDKVLAGARNLGAVPDVRLPITLPILTRLLQAVSTVFVTPYKRLLLRAMMVLAFKAYLRVGEMVPRSRSMMQRCLQVDDILISGDLITLSFKRFKHSGRQGPQSLQVGGEVISGTPIYPASVMREFLQERGSAQASLFAYPDGSPMMRNEFDKSLKLLLLFCGYKTSSFKGHSFRIGAASFAARNGESDAYIRAAGRWSSDAFKKYIRLA